GKVNDVASSLVTRRRQHDGLQVIGANGEDFQIGKNFAEKRTRFTQLLFRNINRDVNRRLLKRFNQNARLGTGTRTKPNQLDIRSKLRRDFCMVSIQDINLGSSDVILWQFANLLEQRSPTLIVEILAG